MRRRLVAAILVGMLAVIVGRVAMDATVPDICRVLDPDHSWTDYILWILNGCGKESAGGGSSSAGAQ